ncbi:MAG: hypothetical protein HKP58_07780, partial [Desulfatitalea sp.]|nr:hypothetical protein [Desulfatitalea sp.]NNK00299.1 hypothetical protein [Desulfatitalea sp.]
MKKNENVKQDTRERDEVGLWKIDKKTRLDMPLPDFSNLPYLSNEEKALGVKIRVTPTAEFGIDDMSPEFSRIWQNQPGFLAVCDPKYYEAMKPYYETLVKLVIGFDSTAELFSAGVRPKGLDHGPKADDPEVRRRWSNAMLIMTAIGFETDDQYYIRYFTTGPTDPRDRDDSRKDYCLSGEKVGMIRHPESSVWDDEERLVLQFTYAVMRRQMTDEIWNRAMAAWGELETT